MPRDAVAPPSLNERLRDILQAVVEDYIASAEPVGSRSLTKRNPGLDLSPATVRNAMADLEDLGYLSALHASAGRIPTALAFKVYVEHLALRGRITRREQEIINAVALPEGKGQDLSQVLKEAGRILSSLANHASLVLFPALEEVVFADLEFVPIRESSVLVVFVAKSGLVEHRVVDVDFPIDRDELRRMSGYLKTLLDGKTLRDVREAIVVEMRTERTAADEMMRHALTIGERSLRLDAPASPSVLVEGERALLEQPEFADVSKMRNLLRAFEQKTILLRLLDESASKPVDAHAAERPTTQVVFGSEGGVRELKDIALIVSSYTSEHSGSGQVGLIGPVRMDYSRMIPLVELTAGALSRGLGANEQAPPDEDSPRRKP